MQTQIQHCRTCGAPIYWLKNVKTGKPAPIDAETDPEKGNVLVNSEDGTYATLSRAGVYEVQHAAAYSGVNPLHTNHFMTCPQAKTWHKAGRRT